MEVIEFVKGTITKIKLRQVKDTRIFQKSNSEKPKFV